MEDALLSPWDSPAVPWGLPSCPLGGGPRCPLGRLPCCPLGAPLLSSEGAPRLPPHGRPPGCQEHQPRHIWNAMTKTPQVRFYEALARRLQVENRFTRFWERLVPKLLLKRHLPPRHPLLPSVTLGPAPVPHLLSTVLGVWPWVSHGPLGTTVGPPFPLPPRLPPAASAGQPQVAHPPRPAAHPCRSPLPLAPPWKGRAVPNSHPQDLRPRTP